MDKSGQRDKVPTKPKSAQAMEATVSPPQFHPRSVTMRNQENRDAPTPWRLTLSEGQSREYSFPTKEVGDRFMGLRELNLIELTKPNRPEEASKFKEPNFYHYHRIFGHTLKGCFVVKNIIQKMIDDGTIDANILKRLKKGKKMATSNVATFDDPMVSHVISKTMPTCGKIMATPNPELVNMAFSRYTPQLKLEGSNETKTILRSAATSRCGKSTPKDQDQQQLSRLQTLQPVRLVSKVPRPFRNTRRHKDELLEKCASLAIGVFEDDDEPLHFPEEEPLVDKVQLSLGRQLPNPYPQSKLSKGKDVTPNEKSDYVSNVSVKYDVIAHLKKRLAMLSVYDALCLSSDLRKAFITMLSFLEDYRVKVSQAEIK
jgi:hypothetical protein